ncbi:hypothetical protein KGQ20_24840 [Catenulispora sp. NF23]|uniref:hypothetical protein n=1 Tax=Catenulispora pinistramenti TaxID=2705254 RepID=UPI001BAD28EF|nr:hypothetical protein [Catenulispora pinistramenti]MBS2535994.1 hypothetical protein [Catenulispora pinistramenti]
MRTEAEVLAVVRTVPSARRLLDVADVFAGDPRIAIHWALDPGSTLGGGARALLEARGIRPLSLSSAADAGPAPGSSSGSGNSSGSGGDRRWRLVLAASENSPLDQIKAPILLLPHGAGHGKGIASERVAQCAPAAIGLANAQDAARLASLSPASGAAARVVGDPCWDRLVASRHRRSRYRAALGVGGSARLVVLSSTWGPLSLFSRHTDLAARLTAALPWDEWRVAMVLHPGVRAVHGDDTVFRWLRPALDRGLLLLDSDDEWRAGLLAADALIGDHGSVTLYGAALGVPTAFACFGWEEVDPEAPIAGLGRAGRYFDAGDALLGQVAELADGAGESGLAERVFAHQGEALERIAEVAYELMEMPRVRRDVAPVAVPLPRGAHPTPSAWWFRTRADGGGVAVERYPVAESMPSGARLLAHVHGPDPRRPAAATVVVGTADLDAYPGAYVAVQGAVVTLRGHGAVEAEGDMDTAVVGAALHAWVFQLGRAVPGQLRVNGSDVRLKVQWLV